MGGKGEGKKWQFTLLLGPVLSCEWERREDWVALEACVRVSESEIMLAYV